VEKEQFFDQRCTFLNNHEHDLIREMATTVPTLSGWIVDLKKIAEQEQVRRDDIETKGSWANELKQLRSTLLLGVI
jgi:hypothetical protein